MRLSLLLPVLPLLCIAKHIGRSHSAPSKRFHTSSLTEPTDSQRRDDAKYVFMHHVLVFINHTRQTR